MKYNYRSKCLACGLAAIMIIILILPHLKSTFFAQDCSNHEWTGLKMYWTDFPYDNKDYPGWPRKTYFKGGNGDWGNMNGMYVYCIANHTGQPSSAGVEAFVKQKLSVSDYEKYTGNDPAQYSTSAKKTMDKLSFCLAAVAAISPGKQKISDCENGISTSYLDICSQALLIAIEGRWQNDAVIDEFDKEKARTAFYAAMEYEYSLNGFDNKQINVTIKKQVLDYRDGFFDRVWDAALVMYNAIEEGASGPTANNLPGKVDSNDPSKYIVTIDCYKTKSVWDNYYDKIKIAEGPGWQINSKIYDEATGIGTLIFQGSAGMDISKNGLKVKFENSDLLTDLSKPVLYEFNFHNPVDTEKCGDYQTMFCAMRIEPTFTVTDDPGDPPPPPPPGEGSVSLEIHRYKHSESWKTNYNVNLIKNDSETGKPLSGSSWDILEYDTLDGQLGSTYLDYLSDEAENIGTKYNWANDGGSQFERWDSAEADDCDRDLNITGYDGYLYYTNTVGQIMKSKAHSDTYDYNYIKGYCTGHPDPVVTYIVCEHKPEDDCDCEEKNDALDELAENAWQEQVDYCNKLADEGGFFHTDETSITDSAKQELEEDRNEFYNDFISLTYDYSAKELTPRDGYILHGKHVDDIPIERVTVHSSEYLSGGIVRAGIPPNVQVEEMEGNFSKATPSNLLRDVNTEKEMSVPNFEIYSDDRNMTVFGSAGEKAPVTLIDLDKKEDSKEEERRSSVGAALPAEDSANTAPTESGSAETSPADIPPTEEAQEETGKQPKPIAGKATSSEPEFDPEDPDTDLEILPGVTTATASDAVRDTVPPERKSILNLLHTETASFLNLDKEKGSMRGKDDSSPPKMGGVDYIGAVNYENSTITTLSKGDSGIEGWTFIVYDHRTEGEIHFNKRDLNLTADRSAYKETYGAENGDGSMEGAVYGLFATQDIYHPDSNGKAESGQDTGLVYQADDLVAVATTDRNGDGSFMAFTEAPGMTYQYSTGKIEKRTDKRWNGPSNLHMEQGKADGAIDDNEKFDGYDEDGGRVSLDDSKAGDNDTYYNKHSSNQGLNKGGNQNDGTTYPIQNNEDNNGNCWIGRPLIVSGKNTAQYYIKELSRSEGYELSVYGQRT